MKIFLPGSVIKRKTDAKERLRTKKSQLGEQSRKEWEVWTKKQQQQQQKKIGTRSIKKWENWRNIYIYIYIYIYLLILSIAKSDDGGNDSIFRFSIYNIHVIQNPKESSIQNSNKSKSK